MNRNRAIAINVKDPSLNIRVWALPGNTDVTGKTITKGQLLTFRIDSNLDAVYTQRGAGAPVTVKVQDPSGNVYNALTDDLGNQNSIVNVPVTSSSMLVPGLGTNGTVWDTANANYRAGSYKVWAESNLNGMKDNYKDPSGADYTGRTITTQYTVTIGTDTLTHRVEHQRHDCPQQRLRREHHRRPEHRLRPLGLRHLLDREPE